MNWGLDFWSVFSMVFLITAIPVAILIIMEKRSPYKTAAWIMALILLPVFGVVFYLFFGQEFRKQKLFSRKGIKSLGQFRKLSVKQLRQFKKAFSNLDEKILEKENLIRLLLNNSNALLTTGNKIKLLETPAITFDAIFTAIKKARHHIHLEYYIFSNDKIGNRLKNLLIEKAREGVQVRVIIDDVGSWGLRKKVLEDIRHSGIEIYSFMEVRFPRLTSKVNYRNHRKIIVIDGQTGFTGGVNIADRYLDGVKGIGPWKDLHVLVEGDAVACLQVVFAADWYFVSHQNLSGEKYFPPMTNSNGVAMQISASGPDSDWENIGQAFFAAIANAKRRVYIVSPYLMPPLQIVSALKTASLSNVDVRIIIPEKSDARIPKWSSFSYVEELLEAGVRVYFYQTGFIHSKYILVDDVFTTVGTTNLDFRSIETNFEVNAFIYNENFTTQLEKIFRKDMQNSREIKLKDWKQRPWFFKFRESLAHTVSPML
jgi:cardiolipin synthase